MEEIPRALQAPGVRHGALHDAVQTRRALHAHCLHHSDLQDAPPTRRALRAPGARHDALHDAVPWSFALQGHLGLCPSTLTNRISIWCLTPGVQVHVPYLPLPVNGLVRSSCACQTLRVQTAPGGVQNWCSS